MFLSFDQCQQPFIALWFAEKEMIRRNSGFIEMLQMIMILWAVKIEAARLCWCVEEWWRGDHCQRSGQPNHSILCGLHRHWATHRRCCQEPGGTQSREHSFLIANSEANMFACDSEHYDIDISWLCFWGYVLPLSKMQKQKWRLSVHHSCTLPTPIWDRYLEVV